MNEAVAFPPFIPAKPKGGVAAEIAASKDTGVVESTFKPKRKRRTREEMAQAAGVSPNKKAKPRGASIPLYSLAAFAGLTSDEIDQVISVCEAVNTFPKAARKRIVAAIGQLFA
jgi:hypothetical protein